MDQRQYEAMLADAEIRLKRLRMLYDQWFLGLERLEPKKLKDEIEALIAELKLKQPRNTALRFRLNQLVQRHVTYNTYWQRVARQIEEGTYKRDVLRARKRFGGQKPAEGEAKKRDTYDMDLDVDVDIDGALAALKTNPPPAMSPDAQPPRNGSSVPPRRDSERALRAHREITPFALPTPAPPPPRGNSGAAQVPAIAMAAVPNAAGAGSLVIPAPPAAGLQGSLRPKIAPPPVPPGVSRRPPPPVPPGAAAKPPPPLASAKPAPVPAVPAKPPGPAMGARPAAGATGGASLSDEQMLNLYQRYVSARRDNKERTDNVRLETVVKTVRDMMPKLKEKHAGKQIDFEVVVKDGRVALKPVPK